MVLLSKKGEGVVMMAKACFDPEAALGLYVFVLTEAPFSGIIY